MFIGAQPRGVRDLIEDIPTSELCNVFCLQALIVSDIFKNSPPPPAHLQPQRQLHRVRATALIGIPCGGFSEVFAGVRGGPRGLLKKALNCCKVAKAGPTVLAGVGLCDDGQIFSTQKIS